MSDYHDFVHNQKDKILVFGGRGGLGSKVCPLLAQYFEVHALGRQSVNILDPEAVEAFVAAHNPQCVLNMVVHNEDSTIQNLAPDVQDRMIDTNVRGGLNILRASIKHFRIAGRGSYIYTSSLLSRRPVRGAGLYSASKAFHDNLVQTAALENAKYNIVCNSIQLGYFDGGLTYKLPEKIRTQLTERIPCQRLGTPEDLACTILMMHKARYMTGAHIDLSGGIAL